MRDIIFHLHECGVSKNGYSIIGQGKIAEIMNAKPEARRAIFEEAVGIATTKEKKINTITLIYTQNPLLTMANLPEHT